MDRNDRSAIVLGVMALLGALAVASPASAMNDPVTGRWITRDPVACNRPSAVGIPNFPEYRMHIHSPGTTATLGGALTSPWLASGRASHLGPPSTHTIYDGASYSQKLYESMNSSPITHADASGLSSSTEQPCRPPNVRETDRCKMLKVEESGCGPQRGPDDNTRLEIVKSAIEKCVNTPGRYCIPWSCSGLCVLSPTYLEPASSQLHLGQFAVMDRPQTGPCVNTPSPNNYEWTYLLTCWYCCSCCGTVPSAGAAVLQ